MKDIKEMTNEELLAAFEEEEKDFNDNHSRKLYHDGDYELLYLYSTAYKLRCECEKRGLLK